MKQKFTIAAVLCMTLAIHGCTDKKDMSIPSTNNTGVTCLQKNNGNQNPEQEQENLSRADEIAKADLNGAAEGANIGGLMGHLMASAFRVSTEIGELMDFTQNYIQNISNINSDHDKKIIVGGISIYCYSRVLWSQHIEIEEPENNIQ